MGLETASFISDLIESNPLGSDQKSQGDNHIRLVKGVLKSTFPNASKGFRFPTTLAEKVSAYTILASDDNARIPINCNSGNITVTLPVLLSSDAGFRVFLYKSDLTTNNMVVAAGGSEKIYSLSSVTIRQPRKIVEFYWDGSIWLIPGRSGQVGDYVWSANDIAPFDCLLADGAAISRTDYAEYFAYVGTKYGTGNGVTTVNLPDIRGEFMRGTDGGAGTDPDSASRTDRGDGTTGDAVGTKQTSQNRAHDHSSPVSTSSGGDHSHGYDGVNLASNLASGVGGTEPTATGKTTSSAGNHSHSVTIPSDGGSEARPQNVNANCYIRVF